MALMNRHLTGLETVFLPGEPQFEHVSSSLVKEVARARRRRQRSVPDVVLPAVAATGSPAVAEPAPVWAAPDLQ